MPHGQLTRRVKLAHSPQLPYIDCSEVPRWPGPMASPQITFDKLVYIDRLKSAGIDEPQARAHAEALDQALRESVATRQDLR
jgi:hypothetical protein